MTPGRASVRPSASTTVGGEAHVYGEDPPRVAIAPLADAATPPEIVVTWPSDRAKLSGCGRRVRSTAAGHFSLPRSIGDETVVGERGFQSVTVGADRIVHAVWLDQRRDPGTPPHKNVDDVWDPMHLMFASA